MNPKTRLDFIATFGWDPTIVHLRPDANSQGLCGEKGTTSGDPDAVNCKHCRNLNAALATPIKPVPIRRLTQAEMDEYQTMIDLYGEDEII